MSFWPEIDNLFAEKKELPSNVKIPVEQLEKLYHKKNELELIISNTQLQLQNLTEENVQLRNNSMTNHQAILSKPPSNSFQVEETYLEEPKNSENAEQKKLIQKLKERMSQKDLEIVKLMGEKNEKLKEISILKDQLKKSPLEEHKPSSISDPKEKALLMQLQSQIGNQKVEIADLKQKLLTAENTIQSLKKQSTDSDKNLPDLTSKHQINALEEEIERLSNSLRETLREVEMLQKENTELQFKKQDMKGFIPISQFNVLEEDFEKIQFQLAESFQENDKLQQQIYDLEKQSSEIDPSMIKNSSKDDFSDIKQKNQEILERNSQLIKENQQLISENEDLKEKTAQLQKENTQIEKSFQIMTENFKSMSKKYQTLQVQVKQQYDKYQATTNASRSQSFPKPSQNLSDSLLEAKTQVLSHPSHISSSTSSHFDNEVSSSDISPLPSPPPPSTPLSSLSSSSQLNTITSGSSQASSPAFGQRIVCPSCGATGRKIKIREDKTQIISYIPQTLYKKVYVCTQCGHKF